MGFEDSPLIIKSVNDTPSSIEMNLPWRERAKIWLCIFLVFSQNMGTSAIIPAIWNYLKNTIGHDSELEVGFVISMFSIGHTCGTPLFHFWSKKRNVKEIFLTSFLLTMLADLWYSTSVTYWMVMCARFLTGFGTANQPVIQSYLASICHGPEMKQIKMGQLAFFSALGLCFGPALTAILTYFLELKTTDIVEHTVVVSYSSIPGLFSACLGLINLVLVICFFGFSDRIQDINRDGLRDEDEYDEEVPQSRQIPASSYQQNVPLLLFLLFVLFLTFFGGSAFESMVPPVMEKFFEWKLYHDEGLWAVVGLLSVVSLMTLISLGNKVKQSILLPIYLFLLALGFGLMTYSSDSGPNEWQFLSGCGIVAFAFPSCMAVCVGLYSRVLGYAPKGFDLTALDAVGSVARFFAPILSGLAFFNHHNGFIIWPSISLSIGIALLILLCCWRLISQIADTTEQMYSQERNPMLHEHMTI
eukprot:TRINITY_DN8149_c0_g1_i1.p1 TRINITY_DN8149_c0_g1~~TRINITY_DN8149_c0_g1_i1.p1  ORF type:complete len:472 (-),score=122.46 TRINITY_DN8149_c0_g1_i1:19-1434(-)